MANYEMVCRHRTTFTPQELLEMELDEEADLSSIKRAYSLLNRDHWNLLLGSDPKIKKFKKVIKILQKERKNVKADLNIAKSTTKLKNDEEIQTKIKEMLAENTSLQQSIRNRLKEIKETENRIRKYNRELEKLRNSQLTTEQFTKKNIEGMKTVEMLENRLDGQVKKFGVITCENHKLREQIDHLLKERTCFNEIWQRQMSQMFKAKKCLLDLFQQCVVTYDKRNECIQTLNALRSKAYKDLQLDTETMTKLEHQYNNNYKVSRFIEIKQQKRIMIDLEHNTANKKREKTLKMNLQKIRYSEILSDIQSVTGQTNLDSIITCFFKQESTNDANFRLLCQVNTEIEEVGKHLKTILENFEKEQQIRNVRAASQKLKLEAYFKQLNDITEGANLSENDLKEKNNHLDQIYEGINKIFKLLRCDRSPFLELLGENENINRYNALLFLDSIQTKVYDYVLAAIYKQKMEKGEKKKGVEAKVIRTERLYPPHFDLAEIGSRNPCPLCVEQEMVSDVIDTLQFAQTKEEVARFLEERLKLPDGLDRLHSVSNCNLPKSREIVQKRYQ